MRMTAITEALGPIVILMAMLAVAEFFFPLRTIRIGSWNRLATNLTLSILALLVYALLYGGLILALHLVVENRLGFLQRVEVPAHFVVLLGVVGLDGATYLAHWLMHKVPVFWQFHLVHHTDMRVDVTTALRQHPLETGLRFGFIAFVALFLGVPIVALLIYRLLSGVNALFEHANISTPERFDRLLSYVWVSPRMHKIHHSSSKSETDSNYGNLLSLFDRFFGTFMPIDRARSVDYGIEGIGETEAGRLLPVLVMPFTHKPTSREQEQ